MTRGRRRASRGFSLLEAIVALVLVGSVGLALFTWINANVDSLVRVQDANARSEAMLNALEYLHGVNPMKTASGDAALGSYSMRWRAEPVSPVVDGVSYPEGVGLHQVALYRVRVAVADANRRPWFEFELRQVGHKRVRELQQ